MRQFIEGSGGAVTANSQDEFGYSPMHAAVGYGHIEMLQYLLSVGGSLDIRDADGNLPLHHCENLTMFQFLMSLGVDPKTTNNDGETLFDCLFDDAQDGEDEAISIINYLVSIGAGKDAPQFSFSTAIDEDLNETGSGTGDA